MFADLMAATPDDEELPQSSAHSKVYEDASSLVIKELSVRTLLLHLQPSLALLHNLCQGQVDCMYMCCVTAFSPHRVSWHTHVANCRVCWRTPRCSSPS
jgi:hypothetical protein